MKHTYLALALTLLITACGGGGGGGGGGSAQQVGQFIDDPVGGLTYSCTSAGGSQAITGTTDADGHFNFIPGQTCTFKVGNVTLGSLSGIPSDGKVTPQDVAGVSRTATAAPSALAIAQFLQSLNDGTTNGKIVIPTATTNALSNISAVTLVSSTGSISQADLQTVVVAAGKTLVSAATAKGALDTQISSGNVVASSGSVSATAPKVLNSIGVTSAASSNSAGLTEQMTATGYYSDGTTQDLTSSVTWSSSDTSMATVSASGVAKGLKKGSATITASLTPSGSTTAIKGSVLQSATDPVLQSIAITHSANPPAGLTDQLTATGTYSDGSTADLTQSVTWSTSNASTATVGASTGLVTGVAKGSATVTATAGTAGITATYSETVVDPTPLNIVISYVTAGLTSIQNTASTALQAILNLSDKTTQTVSSLVNWVVTTVSGGGNATVAVNTNANTATLTGTSAGVISTVANYLGLTSNSLGLTINPLSSISGVVATGAPISGATITVKDSTGALVSTATAGSDGTYSISYDSTQFTPPFVIRADGQSGDTGISLVGLTSSSGTANVTQLSNAIASSVSSTGSPLDLSASPTGLTASAIAAADKAYGAALADVMTSNGVTGSLLNGQYTTAFDKLLDNVSATVKPSGQVIIGTTSGKVGNDLASGITATTPYTSVVLAQGKLPSANDSRNLVNTISASSLLSVRDLESLRANLEKCFSTPSTNRGTPQAPTTDCADSKFVVSSDYTIADGFKHSSYAWNGTRFDSTHTSIFYAGLFGYMLTQSRYDNLKFLKPQIIRPLDAQGTTWAVKFPVQFSDGTIDQMGEVIRSQFMVVKKISSLASNTDNGIRFVGDQRDFQTFIVPVMQKIVNIVTGDYRYETGLNVQFTNQSSSTDPSHRKPVMGKLTGKGLPTGGVYFAQKLDSNGNGVCGNYLPVTSKSAITNNPDLNSNWANVYTSYGCAGVFVMSIAYSGSYTNTTANNARYLKWLGDDGNIVGSTNVSSNLSQTSTQVGNYLTDENIQSIGEGEPYTFEVTLSDGSTVSYVNRLVTRPLTMTEAAKFAYYPTFSSSTTSLLSTYVGAADALIGFGTSAGNVHPWSSAIYWGTGANTGTKSIMTPYTATSATVPCTGTAAASCGNSANWVQGSAGLFQVRSRTADGLEVYSQIRNGF